MSILRIIIIVIYLIVAFPNDSFPFFFSNKSIRGLTSAYGFILGQKYGLNRIETEFPDYLLNVELARASFQSDFPNIEKKLEGKLKDALGEKSFSELSESLKTQINELLGKNLFTREFILNFLERVKMGSSYEIESPIMEYLLAVNYENNPVGEFKDGFRQLYETSGEGKSQGIKLRLQLPKSWAMDEGNRPHIVQKWLSQNGTGLEMIHLDIRDNQGYTPTDEEVEDFFASGVLKDTLPLMLKGTYINSGLFSLEMRKGYWLEMSKINERLDNKFYVHLFMYQFFFREKAIMIMAQVMGSMEEKTKVDQSFERFRPLFKAVINSLVLLQAY